jgi:hypothetical protein
MHLRLRIWQRFLLALLHLAVAWGLTLFSLAYLAPWTGIAALPALVTLFFSFPIALLGLLALYFGGYAEIPGVTWVIFAMLLGAGMIFLLSLPFA